MNENKIKKIYIAGPFFNPAEIKVIEEIKKTCENAELEYYSPKDEMLYNSKTDSPEKATECFNSNIEAMNNNDFMVAVIDNHDAGTLFEMGYFYAKYKRILAFSSVPERQVNLMLAQGCLGFANGQRELLDALIRIKSDNYKPQKYEGEQI